MMQRTLLIAVIALVGFGSAAAQQPTTVRVDPVRLEPVQQLRQVTGNVRAVTRSRVAAIEPGRVIELHVQEGDTVLAGQRLAAIDASRLQIQLRQLEADLSVQEALLAERAALVELRESDLQLIKEMQQRGAINPKELSDARLELSVAQARKDQAARELVLKEAEADLLRQRLDDTVISAPFAGKVIARLTERGEWVAEGAAIVELVSTSSFDVWLDVPQRLTRAASRSDLPVMVHVDALERTFESRASRIVGEVDPVSRTFPLVVRIDADTSVGQHGTTGQAATDDSADAPTPNLAPGMSVTAWIATEAVSQQLTVHKDAVGLNDSGAFILVVRDSAAQPAGAADAAGQTIVAPVPIEIVFAMQDRFVVRSQSLAAGDRAVIEGGERLRPGTVVRVVGPPANAQSRLFEENLSGASDSQ